MFQLSGKAQKLFHWADSQASHRLRCLRLRYESYALSFQAAPTFLLRFCPKLCSLKMNHEFPCLTELLRGHGQHSPCDLFPQSQFLDGQASPAADLREDLYLGGSERLCLRP